MKIRTFLAVSLLILAAATASGRTLATGGHGRVLLRDVSHLSVEAQ